MSSATYATVIISVAIIFKGLPTSPCGPRMFTVVGLANSPPLLLFQLKSPLTDTVGQK
nr:MAG TPA: hypothetical protein [Caudoviricetes sp.]